MLNRRAFTFGLAASQSLAQTRGTEPARAKRADLKQIYPGVWKLTLGEPERFTPCTLRRRPIAIERLRNLPVPRECPVDTAEVRGLAQHRGYLISIPLAADEIVYGLGLQLKSHIHRGLKRTLRVNADPVTDAGDSHAPVPFYVTTAGYGVLIDTARYATFWCGGKVPKGASAAATAADDAPSRRAEAMKSVLPEAYFQRRFDQPTKVLVEIPSAAGADVYIFGGPSMLYAVQRYNLFSGGGCVPPRWGLGIWYRTFGQFGQEEVSSLARDLRAREMPCDVIGLEPGWQSHAYSCSFVWSDKFPEPKRFFSEIRSMNYQVNAWEHAFTHPSSPIYKDLLPYSGNYEVWGGIAPDFNQSKARSIFGRFQAEHHVDLGLSGYKLDECDNSDYTRSWSFPEASQFPSGLDGEQYHAVFGHQYGMTIEDIFVGRNQRTYGLIRNNGVLGASLPFALYSDLYEHRDFIRGVSSAGFSGLLWTPEVRDAENTEDLIRRIQSVVLSPMALINAWYIKNPPWKQVNRSDNNAGKFASGWEAVEEQVRELFRLRMRLVPYLYSSFVRYYLDGLPPCRALVLDYPSDPATWAVDDAWLLGDSLLVAPVVHGENERSIYLPEGDWFDFWDGKRHRGKQSLPVHVPLSRVPIFVKSGSLLPLAEPTLHVGDAASRQLTVQVYGDGSSPFTLYEDDDRTLELQKGRFNRLTLHWDGRSGTASRQGQVAAPRYDIRRWQKISG